MEQGLAHATSEKPSAARRQPDLTQRDWLVAGQTLLKRGGLRALKLRPLAEELGVSTGSFYHHYADFGAYQGQLAGYFAGRQVEDVIAEVRRREAEPFARIRLLTAIVAERRLARLALAMHAWAESDSHARAAVDQHEDAVRGFLAECLEALGFGSHEAAVRAFAIMAVGLGPVHAPELKTDSLADELLHILCSPVAACR